MTLDVANDVTFTGPALPEGYVRYELETALKGVLVRGTSGDQAWSDYRRRVLHEPLAESGSLRVLHAIVQPLAQLLGYALPERDEESVLTREGKEDGGYVLRGKTTALRVWPLSFGANLDAAATRGQHYRYAPARIAGRVLLVKGERLGLVTNGVEIRLLLSDPARSDSAISFSLDQWRTLRHVSRAPDGFALLLALTRPETAGRLPALLDAARLKQARVTKDLRIQARQAVEILVQSVLDHPNNATLLVELRAERGTHQLAADLWHEALVSVYRLLFILHGEAAGAFSFAGTSLWRNTFSPSIALGSVAAQVVGQNVQTGRFLEEGVRRLFALFEQGINCTELKIEPFGGQLFGPGAIPLLDKLSWGERGCAALLDKLLRAPQGKGKQTALVRLSYRDLDVEELGRVYESLLELEPGIAEAPMVRLRRAKLEVVVNAAQGERYRAKSASPLREADAAISDEDLSEEGEGSDAKTVVEWIEDIRPGQFYVRVGLGRKASGSFYTPESFVRFLVEETLEPHVSRCSPPDDPRPDLILRLNCLDPAAGSGHFLVGACRFLGSKLYDACLSCAENGRQAELDALSALARDEPDEALGYQALALEWWGRIPAEVQPYLPGRAVDGTNESGISADRARALCRRLIAINCLYGVDKNPLAVELARLSLWLVSQAEGMPLTFLNHRIIAGDSLIGPLVTDLVRSPVVTTVDAPDLFYDDAFRDQFRDRLKAALVAVAKLDAGIGADVTELTAKEQAKAELDAALAPFQQLARAWTGAVMLGAPLGDDLAYLEAAKFLGEHGRLPDEGEWSSTLLAQHFTQMLTQGEQVAPVCYALSFPEVFFPEGDTSSSQGFDAVLGNPPWDQIVPLTQEFYASYDLNILAAPTKAERDLIEKKVAADPHVQRAFQAYVQGFEQYKRVLTRLYVRDAGSRVAKSGATPDLYQFFAIQTPRLLRQSGRVGLVLPSAFYANEGAAALRDLYLRMMTLEYCYSFENVKKIFEIDGRFKFATIVATKTGNTKQFRCAFYLHDDGWLSPDYPARQDLVYTLDFLRKTGGEHATFPELRSAMDVEVAHVAYATSTGAFAQILSRYGVDPGEELHMTKSAHRFLPARTVQKLIAEDEGTHEQIVRAGYYVLYEGKTMHQFSDSWGEPPRYVVPLSHLIDRPDILDAARYYRLGWRAIARSTDERTVISTVLMPGGVAGNSLAVEHKPNLRPNASVLFVSGLANTFPFDWLVRSKASANVNKFILESIPVPQLDSLKAFIVHAALRLVCNHAGYGPLWNELLGEEWSERDRLIGDVARWEVRSAIDAVVAQSYGLSRDQYAHILHSFDRKSGQNPYTDLCLARWDELHELGLHTFILRHDPYHEIALVETLPLPALTLPQLQATPGHVSARVSRGKKEAAAIQQRLEWE